MHHMCWWAGLSCPVCMQTYVKEKINDREEHSNWAGLIFIGKGCEGLEPIRCPSSSNCHVTLNQSDPGKPEFNGLKLNVKALARILLSDHMTGI